MTISESILEDINWWKDNIMGAISRIKSYNYRLVVTSDASRQAEEQRLEVLLQGVFGT